jgi:peptide/nickel transport system substrate-binding protein
VTRNIRKLLLAVAVAAALGAAGATISSAGAKKSEASKAGGTYNVAFDSSFGFTDNFDPTGEYLGQAIGIYSNLLVRTLVGYNHVAGAAGNKIVPDLATSVPKPTNGGKTYTFHLKNGIKFGPPVNREITSKDFVTAMQRLATPKDGAQYAFYYPVIKGWDAFAAGKAKTISGIKTPNAKTIVFNLTQPTGDFLYRVSMPAAGPIPAEVAKCFEGQPGKYGRDVVSSGPYMIEGSDKADASSCAKLKPFSGFDAQTTMTLVRNPSYDPKTDTKAARENLPDQFHFVVNTNNNDIFNKIGAGELQDEGGAQPSPAVIRQYVTDPSKKKYLKINSGDRTWYITMNLTQAPFDDIHVRKAMNWVMDKDALRKAWGGPTAGTIANHIVPDTLFNNQIKSFRPYGTPGDHGSAAKAMAEMKKSKYDTNHDGKCDAKECKGVLLIADARGQDPGMVSVIQADGAKIGITFTVRVIRGAYPTIQTPKNNIPIAERPGWGKDYADALTFFQALFTSGAIIKAGNTNYSLVGVTPKIAEAVGASGNLKNIPSVDGQFDKCSRLSGQPRLTCFENMDKYLMLNVVPWVPYLSASVDSIIAPNVTKWAWDQFGGTTAYAHVAVKS